MNLQFLRGKDGIASIQVKLVLAFMLVSVLPMLAAAQLATRVVVSAFDNNVETWLRETSSFFLASLNESHEDATVVARFMTSQTGLMDRLVSGEDKLTPEIDRLIADLGYDLVVIQGADHNLIFRSRQVGKIEQLSVASDMSLYRVELPDQVMLMTAGITKFALANKVYYLMLGSWVDENLVAELKSITSLELRLYYPVDGRFQEVFSSRRGATMNNVLPIETISALRGGSTSVFDREADAGNYRAVYTALRDPGGEVVAIVFCGLSSRESLSGWLTQARLFTSIFVVGILLSIIAGIAVSRRLSNPLRTLVKGVRAIADGDYSQRTPVQGRDEVAELASAFNEMAARLQQLKIVENDLRRRDRLSALGKVAVGIAHEVRNPLGIIKTSAEIVQKGKGVSATDARMLGHVVDEVRRIDQLIRDFLEFAKPQAPALESIDPMSVIRRVVEVCGPEFERLHITATTSVNAHPLLVSADPNQLFQAALNLVLNALDAMPDGGELSIKLERRDGFAILSFSDTGHGIPSEIQERIFDPFFTTKQSGSGLGLARVYAIMETHHGRVECLSQGGRGTTFALLLPLQRVFDADA